MKADIDPDQLQTELKHFAARNPAATSVHVFVEDDNGTFAVLVQPNVGKPMCFDLIPQDAPPQAWEDAADQLAQAFAQQGTFAASRGPAAKRPAPMSYTPQQLVLALIQANWLENSSSDALQTLLDGSPEAAWALKEMGQTNDPVGLRNAAHQVFSEAREALDSD